MKCLSKKTINGGTIPILEVEIRPKGFLRKQIIKEYMSTEKYVADYYRWVELPDKTIVDDSMSFQLDEWMRQWSKIEGELVKI